MLPSWLTNPLWGEFSALLPEHPTVDPSHPPGCHWPRISDRIVFDKLLQLLRFAWPTIERDGQLPIHVTPTYPTTHPDVEQLSDSR